MPNHEEVLLAMLSPDLSRSTESLGVHSSCTKVTSSKVYMERSTKGMYKVRGKLNREHVDRTGEKTVKIQAKIYI